MTLTVQTAPDGKVMAARLRKLVAEIKIVAAPTLKAEPGL